MAYLSRLGGALKNALKSSRGSAASVALPSSYILSRGFSSGKLFVGGLSWSTDERGLRDAFSAYGELVEVRVITDRETGRSRGFGFVSFLTEQEASKAIEAMDGKPLDGRSVRVNYATQRQPGMGGGFGGGGGFAGGGGGYGGGGEGGGGEGGNYGGGGGGYGGGGGGYGGGGFAGSGGYSSGGGGTFGGSAFGGKRDTNVDPFDGVYAGPGDAYKPPEEEGSVDENRPPSTGGYGVTSSVGGYGNDSGSSSAPGGGYGGYGASSGGGYGASSDNNSAGSGGGGYGATTGGGYGATTGGGYGATTGGPGPASSDATTGAPGGYGVTSGGGGYGVTSGGAGPNSADDDENREPSTSRGYGVGAAL